jgi:hypothetical protein
MQDLHSEIQASINAFTRLLDFIRSRPYADLSPAFTFRSAVRVLDIARHSALAELEVVVQDVFKRRDPSEGSDPSRAPGPPISQGVLDKAVEFGVMSPDEREIIMSALTAQLPAQCNWDDDVSGLMRQLQSEVETLRQIASGCLPPTQVARASSTPPTTAQTRSHPPVDDTYDLRALERRYKASGENEKLAFVQQAIRRQLEYRFKATIEDEIDGTLGRILIFKNPPNTSPERIAVKTIDRDRLKTRPAEGATRFLRELKHWISYRHSPFIITPFYTEVVCGWPYVAMPYCDSTLRKYINGARELRESLALMVQVCCGLQYARERGLRAHQDLKPENVLLQDLHQPPDYPLHWRPRVADFGLANAYLELDVPWGSRPYLAPEQYEKDADLSAVDVFACGVMLHEMVTGYHPIGERTSDIWPNPSPDKPRRWLREDWWKAWSRSDNKLLSLASNDLGDLRDVVAAALSTNPNDRPSVESFQQRLLGALKACDAEVYVTLLMYLVNYQSHGIFAEACNTDPDADAARYRLEHIGRITG